MPEAGENRTILIPGKTETGKRIQKLENGRIKCLA
jgi:hypothetical protein